jgi:hypothetical protein
MTLILQFIRPIRLTASVRWHTDYQQRYSFPFLIVALFLTPLVMMVLPWGWLITL